MPLTFFKPSISLLLALSSSLMVAPATVSAVTLVNYSFGESAASGTLIPDIGADLSALTWNSGGVAGYANEFFNQGATLAVGSFSVGEYYQITLNTTGYENVVLNSFRGDGSNSAPSDWKIAYSTTGASGTFVDATTFSLGTSTAVGNSTISGFTLSSAADNNADIVIRFIAITTHRIDAVATAANGTFRIDNISVDASPIPEPATVPYFAGVVALSATVLLRRCRRQQFAARGTRSG